MTEDLREKQRAANKAYYERNKERIKERNRKWREEHPDLMKQYNAEWYAANRDHAIKTKRQYRASNPERMKGLVRKWYLANKDKTISTARLQRTGCTPEQYQDLLAKQNGLCAICGELPRHYALNADHDHVTNAMRGLLCGPCNRMLGLSGDSADRLRAAADYLDRHNS